jgi:hypothetical protein
VRRLPPHAVPLAAGLAAALAAFAVVALTTDEGGDRAAVSRETRAEPAPAGSTPGARAEPAPAAPAPAPGARAEGRLVFARMGCGSCHHFAATDSRGVIGPSLDHRLAGHTRASLTAQILSPDPSMLMPTDFGQRMTEAELAALVDFLLAARRSP